MGAFLTLILNLGEIAAELSATTGLTLETLLSGEALAALEAEVASVMTIQGITGIEALTQLGFTAEQFANMSLVASLVQEGVSYGLVFQTLSGVSALVGAGIKYGQEQVSTVNRNRRAFFHGQHDILSQALLSFRLDPLNWGDSIITALANEPIKANDGLKNLILNSRWVIASESSSDSASGNLVNFYPPTGGTNQQSTPDWMLPLILGLSGDRTPELSYLQNAIKKKTH
ncbi:VP2 structural protein [bat polyomavirus 2c]|uniref:Minor capsid protein VP2 n=1 Tax=bat polyomavirus 2c TaxID=2758133 RepID=J7HC71_9POLY|nr:VP2 structural protein [Betapolyomavirus arplanirostris]AFP94185.1 VP2 structural protein [bat polyomavirus 2c]